MKPETSKPMVSICCTTYNHEDFIGTAIESFLSQEVDFAIEILIHDDASTDKTPQIVKGYQEKYPGLVRAILQEQNQYSQGRKVLTECIFPEAKGKYIAVCEGDDYWVDPQKLQKQFKFLEENEQFVGCFTNYKVVDNEGVTHKEYFFENMKKSYDHLDILRSQTPKTLTVMFRRELLPKTYSKELKKCLNGDLILSSYMSKHGPYGYLDFVSGAYREHLGGIWSLKGDKSRYQNQVKTSFTMMDHFNSLDEIDALRHRLKNACKKLMKIYEHEGDTNMLKWCKSIQRKALFKYSAKQIFVKFFNQL